MKDVFCSILREGEPDKFKASFEVVLGNFLNDGYVIKFALLDRNDKLVLILQKSSV